MDVPDVATFVAVVTGSADAARLAAVAPAAIRREVAALPPQVIAAAEHLRSQLTAILAGTASNNGGGCRRLELNI